MVCVFGELSPESEYHAGAASQAVSAPNFTSSAAGHRAAKGAGPRVEVDHLKP